MALLIPFLAGLVQSVYLSSLIAADLHPPGSSSQEKRIGMAILWEASQKYPQAFQSEANNNTFYQGHEFPFSVHQN